MRGKSFHQDRSGWAFLRPPIPTIGADDFGRSQLLAAGVFRGTDFSEPLGQEHYQEYPVGVGHQ